VPPRTRQTTAEAKPPAGRRWSTTDAVRAEFLDAARAVFATRGFTEASVAEVVERAGASVGSLYHHFGSKTDLFLALWERHHEEQLQIARSGVAKARQAGVVDPFDLFVAGARAYLEATWSRRDLVRIFQFGDTPPGFQEVQRRGGRAWIGANFKLLGTENDPVHRVLIWLVTSFLGEARREIAKARSARAAQAHVDAMIEVLKRMRPVITHDLGIELIHDTDEA
jgi:AcrR family transcriptional regulator